ncbi:hypothetical protein PsYK624_118500 [Phanerochaete sordida]|uniref:Uncharacterized protein n=1 Tax=Phanerochaete sordida TaxID=48140 RepID=A0A9P3LIH1_9APHY|nr:hypothetical protein PsYK624_118500 [Phanerochaete sordida]
MFPTFAGNRHRPRTFPADLLTDLHWWTEQLSHPPLKRPLPGEISVVDVNAFSDASTSFGVAVVIDGRWQAWSLLDGWKGGDRDIGWLEALGLELAVRAVLLHGPPAEHFLIHVDNQGIVDGWRNGRSRNWETNEVFKRIHRVLALHRRQAYTVYVPSADNVADAPSRGLFPPRAQRLRHFDLPPTLDRYLRLATR